MPYNFSPLAATPVSLSSSSSLNACANSRASSNCNLNQVDCNSSVISLNSNARFSYNKQIFKSFVDSFSRLFCEDEEIIVLDLLLEDERSYTERDIAEKLLWTDKKIREICVSLEKQLVLLKDNWSTSMTTANVSNGSGNNNILTSNDKRNESYEGNAAGNNGNAKSGSGGGGCGVGGSLSTHWYINPHICAVMRYKYDKLFATLAAKTEELEGRELFKCINCKKEYDGLEAQMLDLHPHDANFLCKLCGERLEHDDNNKREEEARSLQSRALSQLSLLKKYMDRAWGMEIPKFEKFTKADKTKIKKNSEQENSVVNSNITFKNNNNISASNEQLNLHNNETHSFFKTSASTNSTLNINDLSSSYGSNSSELINIERSDSNNDAKNITNVTNSNNSAKNMQSIGCGHSNVSSSVSKKPLKFSMKKNISINLQQNKAQNKAQNTAETRVAVSRLNSAKAVSSSSVNVANKTSSTFAPNDVKSAAFSSSVCCNVSALSESSEANHKRGLPNMLGAAQQTSALNSSSCIAESNKRHQVNNLSSSQNNSKVANSVNHNNTPSRSISHVNNNKILKPSNNASSASNDTKSDSQKTIYISKYNKYFSLLGAQQMQQEMNEAEFLEFSELQDAYLNDF